MLILFQSPTILLTEDSTLTSTSSLEFPGSSLESVNGTLPSAYLWPLRPFVKLVVQNNIICFPLLVVILGHVTSACNVILL